MVGIVLVSHSNTLISGIREMVSQMVPAQDNIAYTGGINDEENPIGTDPVEVMNAINNVYSDDGVLVIMDLGSALLSTETALDLLEPEKREHIRLSCAPIVEGALSAAVQASLGSDIETVAREADNALRPKIGQIGGEVRDETPAVQAKGLELKLDIINPNGLHARPATKLVACAGKFASDISLAKNGKAANAKSINQVTTLGVRKGDSVTFWFDGKDAAEALEAVRKLYGRNFDEDITEKAPAAKAAVKPAKTAKKGIINGTPVARGVAVGPVYRYIPRTPEVNKKDIRDTEAEIFRLKTALEKSLNTVESLRKNAEKTAGKEQAEIFEFHKLLLQDADTVNKTVAAITQQKVNAEYAWKSVTDEVVKQYQNIDDEYFRIRADDVRDIQKTVLIQLSGKEKAAFDMKEPVIVAAHELSPSEAASLPRDRVLGLCLASGGATSHAAIIAAARGIPAVAGAADIMESVKDGRIIVLNGDTGEINTAPDSKAREKSEKEMTGWQNRQKELKQSGKNPAVTADGLRIIAAANIGGTEDVPVAAEYGAEEIGLFRTEFLFLGRPDEPDENEQYEIYKSVSEGMDNRPVIIRTLDIGGDKPVPYLYTKHEDNPFLGLRGVRFTIANKDLFLTQLRAILRASAGTNIRIMFPMISSLPEFIQARDFVEQAKQQLRDRSEDFNDKTLVGIMVEVPAAVAVADQLAREVDFFSIGTNDLTQYVMAADRGNSEVAYLSSPLHPAVLRMIKQTTEAAHKHGIPVGMCGALAGKAEAAELLVGLGLDELSMNAPQIPEVKKAIRKLTSKNAQELAEKALKLDSAEAVKELIGDV